MIANDQELQGTQERIAFFYRLLAQMRITRQPRKNITCSPIAIWLKLNACTRKC
jgi:hypothetical protein